MRVRSAVIIVAVASLGLVAFATSADAGKMEEPLVGAPLTINKVVSGPVPAGTTFTVTVSCDEPTIFDGDETGLTSATVTFNAAGAATSDNVIEFFEQNQCTVSETVTGGATTVSYACAGEIPGRMEKEPGGVSESGIEEDPTDPCLSVTSSGVEVLIDSEDQFATVTVTNTFVAAAPVQPAAAVVAQPAFTG